MDDKLKKISIIGLVFLFGVAAAFVVYNIVQTAGQTDVPPDPPPEQQVSNSSSSGSDTDDDDPSNESNDKDSSDTLKETIYDAKISDSLSPSERVKKAVEQIVSEDTDIKEIAEQTSVIVRYGKHSLSPLKEAARHENAQVREWAISTIGDLFAMGNETGAQSNNVSFEDVKDLLGSALLEDSNEGVRLEAAMALGKTGDPNASIPLRKAVENAGSKKVKEAAEFAWSQVD